MDKELEVTFQLIKYEKIRFPLGNNFVAKSCLGTIFSPYGLHLPIIFVPLQIIGEKSNISCIIPDENGDFQCYDRNLS